MPEDRVAACCESQHCTGTVQWTVWEVCAPPEPQREVTLLDTPEVVCVHRVWKGEQTFVLIPGKEAEKQEKCDAEILWQ